MQRDVRRGGRLHALCLISMCAAVACGSQPEDPAPAVATASVTLSHTRIPQGSPVDMAYRFEVAQAPESAGDYRVFVHILDADDELMWTDDHIPPAHPNGWTAGETVEYARTMFAPLYPYVGAAKVVIGVYDVETGARLKLGNPDRGDRSYEVASFDLAPQTESVYVIYRDGWHPAEAAADNPAAEWKWTRKEATLSFRNPKRDATLILQMDNPAAASAGASEVEIRLGDHLVGTVPVGDAEAPVHKLDLSTEQLGSAETVEVRLVANRTFVPALEAGSNSTDTRELGVRVFHAFVQPK